MNKAGFIVNTFWSFISQSGAIVISLIANILLARLLSPSEFGQIGIIMFFVTLMNAFSEGGLGGALVRKQTIDDKDFSTVFLFNLFLSTFLYFVLFFSSNTIAEFYGDSKLANLIKVSGFMIIINSLSIIQNVRIYHAMAFKLNMKINLTSSIIGSAIGVILAYNSFGIWSLVIMNILVLLIRTVYLWIHYGKIKILIFDVTVFKNLLNYGFFTTVVSLLSTTFDNIIQLILAKYFNLRQSGYFYQAKKIQGSPYSVLNSVVLGVFFSQLSKDQDNVLKFYNNYISVFKIFSVFVVAVTSIFVVAGDEIIVILIGKQWLPAVLYMKVLSVAALFLLLKVYAQNILKIYNRAGNILKFEFFSYIIQVLSIIAGIYFRDILFLLIGLVLANVLGYVISTYYSWKMLNLKSSFEYIFLLKIILIASVVILLIGSISDVSNIYLSLFYKIFLFSFMFIGVSILSKTLSIADLRNLKL